MNFSRFLFFQGLTFMLYVFAVYLVNGSQDFAANVVMNFLTFFSVAWVITMLKSDRSKALPDVLSSTLSFNTVTYLLAYALHSPLPSWHLLIFDYFMVTVYSLIGFWAALRMKQHQSER